MSNLPREWAEVRYHDDRCVIFCPFGDTDAEECPQGHGLHDCSCAELAADDAERDAGAMVDMARD